MSTLSGETLARLTATVVVRASALTGQLPAGSLDLAPLLYRAGGCVPDPRRDPRWAAHVVTAAARLAGDALSGHDHSVTAHWQSWTRPGTDPDLLIHKIYVSPLVDDLAATLRVVLAAAPLLDVPAWKVGADLAGLHRPDKIVLYLPDAARADTTATALAEGLAGIRAQGVPFTGQVGPTRLVSRGRDVAGTSWRAEVCRLVADAVTAGRATLGCTASAVEVAEHALDLVARTGIDVETWHPTDTRQGTPAVTSTPATPPIQAATSSAAPPAAARAHRPGRWRLQVTCS
ncbi:MAG: hypothetical protein JWP82_3264 [Humibacillus sp.]|nr:hypothetical protein [Humibacillus sp.]